jgi:hypothetical protein
LATSIVQEGPVVKQIGPFRFHALIHRELGLALPSHAIRLVGEDGKSISVGTVDRDQGDLDGLRRHLNTWTQVQEQRIRTALIIARQQDVESEHLAPTLDLVAEWRAALEAVRVGMAALRHLPVEHREAV